MPGNESSAKETARVSEIEHNGLLKRFVVRPAERREGTTHANPFSPAPVMAASPLAGVEIGRNAGLLFNHSF
jgi:hypothetical protein